MCCRARASVACWVARNVWFREADSTSLPARSPTRSKHAARPSAESRRLLERGRRATLRLEACGDRCGVWFEGAGGQLRARPALPPAGGQLLARWSALTRRPRHGGQGSSGGAAAPRGGSHVCAEAVSPGARWRASHGPEHEQQARGASSAGPQGERAAVPAAARPASRSRLAAQHSAHAGPARIGRGPRPWPRLTARRSTELLSDGRLHAAHRAPPPPAGRTSACHNGPPAGSKLPTVRCGCACVRAGVGGSGQGRACTAG